MVSGDAVPDQKISEDRGWKPAWANSHKTLSQKNPSQKGLVEWLKV
jgi:hypothetical protein